MVERSYIKDSSPMKY